jgi:hypothetical protein
MKADRRMIWQRIKQKRISILVFCLAALSLLVVHVFWLNPILTETDEMQARVLQQKQMIQKYQEKLDQSKDLKEKLEKQGRELSRLQRKVFHGDDSYQLAATLGELPSFKGTQDLTIKSYQVLASKEYGLYQEVQLKFDFTATIKGLYQFLSALKKSPTAILVQQLRIQRVQRKTGHDLVLSVVLSALMEPVKKS